MLWLSKILNRLFRSHSEEHAPKEEALHESGNSSLPAFQIFAKRPSLTYPYIVSASFPVSTSPLGPLLAMPRILARLDRLLDIRLVAVHNVDRLALGRGEPEAREQHARHGLAAEVGGRKVYQRPRGETCANKCVDTISSLWEALAALEQVNRAFVECGPSVSELAARA